MIPYLPKQIATKAIYLYLGALAAVTVFFLRRAMSIDFIIMGILWVVGFFLLSSLCTRKWQSIPEKHFIRNIFLTALGVRAAWVFISYVFYTLKTGIPFEFSAADSMWYYGESVSNIGGSLQVMWRYLFVDTESVSDSGYVFYLSLLAQVFGESVVAPRLVNSVLSAYSCVLLYRLAQRNIGDEGGRMAAVFACFMPNLVIYCGLHLKETVMLFVMVAYLERTDYLLRSRSYNVVNIALPVLLAAILFTFRTAMGMVAIFSAATALVFASSKVVGKAKRYILIAWAVLAVSTFAGGIISNEVSQLVENRSENQVAKREAQSRQGNRWAKYATGTVMAPMMFVLPFPTMVKVEGQENQLVMSGGNYVRTFLGGFVMLALVVSVFVKKNWRDMSLVGSFAIAYLAIISSSGFAGSERFLLPGLPLLLIMAAYGITTLSARGYRFIRIWYWVVPVMVFGWAFFKLGTRALL